MIFITLKDLITIGFAVVTILFCFVMYALIKIDKKKGGES